MRQTHKTSGRRRRRFCLLAGLLLLAPCAMLDARAQSPRETPIVRAVRTASPSVVNLHGQKTVRATAAGFAGSSPDSFRQVNGMGTGVVIDPRGYLITNFHVVEDVSDVRVTLSDGQTVAAELIAQDRASDLAVLKVNVDRPLPVIPRGTSNDLMVGEPVVAIGNAFGYENTVTHGIISALHRDVPVNESQEYRDLIQTSAGINPGNSGGPLLNVQGQMIGINVAVRVGAQAIAFAIPVDQALDTVTDLIETHNQQRAFTGIQTDRQSGAAGVVRVGQVAAGSPAASQGIRPGDRIVKAGKQEVSSRFDFALAMLEIRPGQSVELEIEREGQDHHLSLVAASPAVRGSLSPGQKVWEMIGVRAEPLVTAEVRRMNTRLRTSYKGGLKITGVRSGSPAARQGIEPGDVLLGIHGWQTATLDDLEMIVERPEMQRGPQAKFYIVRSEQTLFGFLQLAQAEGTASR